MLLQRVFSVSKLSTNGIQRRYFDATSLIVGIPAFYLVRNILFKARRDAFSLRAGCNRSTENYGNVQFSVEDKENKLAALQNVLTELPASNVRVVDQDIVLFFHDAPGGCDQYKGISACTTFQLGFPVLSLSRPGYLETEFIKRASFTNVSLMHQSFLEDELKLVDSSLGLNEQPNRIHLLGFGVGGMYALHFAKMFPNLASSLTLMSARTRLDGCTVHSKEQSTALEGASLKTYLEHHVQLGTAAIATDFLEMMATSGFKIESKMLLKSQWSRGEFTTTSRDLLIDKLIDDFCAGKPWEGRERDSGVGNAEHGWQIMRIMGASHMHKRPIGLANDFCNAAAVEIDFEKVRRHGPRLMTQLMVVKAEMDKMKAEKAKAKETGAKEEAGGDTASEVAMAEARIRERLANKTQFATATDTSGIATIENAEFLKSIQCPTLIIHSKEDGKAPFSFHAEHAERHIPTSKLVTLQGFPHTLPLKDPRRVEQEIDNFIHEVKSQCSFNAGLDSTKRATKKLHAC